MKREYTVVTQKTKGTLGTKLGKINNEVESVGSKPSLKEKTIF